MSGEAARRGIVGESESGVVSEPRPLPGSLLAVGVIVLVLGVLAAIGGGLIFLIAWLAGEFPADFQVPATGEAMAAFLVVVAAFGVILVVAAVAHIVVGIGVIRRRSWARVAGLVVAFVGIVLTLTGSAFTLLSPSAQIDPFTGEPFPPMTGAEIGINVVLVGATVIAFLYVAVVLARRGDAFGAV